MTDLGGIADVQGRRGVPCVRPKRTFDAASAVRYERSQRITLSARAFRKIALEAKNPPAPWPHGPNVLGQCRFGATPGRAHRRRVLKSSQSRSRRQRMNIHETRLPQTPLPRLGRGRALRRRGFAPSGGRVPGRGQVCSGRRRQAGLLRPGPRQAAGDDQRLHFDHELVGPFAPRRIGGTSPVDPF